MAQFARPSSDVSNTGWTRSTGSSDYVLIDESVADDADYIQHVWNGAANSVEVALSAISTPSSTSGHVVRYRVSMGEVGPYVDPQNLQVSLVEGASIIASQVTDVGTVALTWTTFTMNLSAGEAGSITDFGNLSLRFEETDGDSGKTVRVSWAEYEAPNAAAGSGGFTATVPLMEAKLAMFDMPYQKATPQTDILAHFSGSIEDTDDRIWYSKPRLGDRGFKVCAWCGRKVPDSLAVQFDGSWHCPEHIPRTYDKGPNAWRL